MIYPKKNHATTRHAEQTTHIHGSNLTIYASCNTWKPNFSGCSSFLQSSNIFLLVLYLNKTITSKITTINFHNNMHSAKSYYT